MMRFASLRQDRISTERRRRDGKAFGITFGLQGLLKTIRSLRPHWQLLRLNPIILHGRHYRGGLLFHLAKLIELTFKDSRHPRWIIR